MYELLYAADWGAPVTRRESFELMGTQDLMEQWIEETWAAHPTGVIVKLLDGRMVHSRSRVNARPTPPAFPFTCADGVALELLEADVIDILARDHLLADKGG